MHSVTMEIGKVTFVRSKFLNESIAVLSSVRKPGYVYRFAYRHGNQYRCCSCKALGKDRNISIVDGEVIGRKHPENDHHPDCQPLPEATVKAQQLDKDMRHEVRDNSQLHNLT